MKIGIAFTATKAAGAAYRCEIVLSLTALILLSTIFV